MFKVEKVIDARGQTLIQDPPIARFFFQSTITSVLWLAVRLYVGYDFLIAGWHKFTTPAWMDGSGSGIIGFWKGALGTTASYVIVFGELAVGVGLILGAFVGLAAAGGLLMNFAFLLAGTTSTNPVLVMLGFLLILAWKNSGYIGLDYFLLPMLGTPWWKPGKAPAPATRMSAPAAATR